MCDLGIKVSDPFKRFQFIIAGDASYRVFFHSGLASESQHKGSIERTHIIATFALS